MLLGQRDVISKFMYTATGVSMDLNIFVKTETAPLVKTTTSGATSYDKGCQCLQAIMGPFY